jgi:integrase/recombinase XerD
VAIRPATEEHRIDEGFMELVLDFLGYLELERGMARNTLQSYRSDLLQFGEFVAERDLDALTLGPRDVSDFLTELGSTAATATIKRKAACLRSLLKQLLSDYLL